MSWTDLAIALAVLAVIAWLARKATVGARLALGFTALLVSAGMFLPSSILSDLIGPNRLAVLTSLATPYSVGALAHFMAFLLLALTLWLLRPDLRGWRAISVLLVLAIASELMQGLTIERSTRLEDMGTNLLGAGVGLILGTFGAALSRRHREYRAGLTRDKARLER